MVKPSKVVPIALLLAVSGLVAWGKKQKAVKYRNTDPSVKFTGSKSCGTSGCHEELSRNYYRTAHGNALGPANSPTELAKVPNGRVTVYNKNLNRYFEVVRIGSDLYQTQYELDENGNKAFSSSHKLAYRIGGHTTGNIYIIRWGQNFFQAPLSYYLRTKQWDMAPGYQNPPRPFNRPIIFCPYCHNGQPEGVPNRAGMYADPPFRFMEYGISCEVCHGPGEVHEQELIKHPKRRPGKVDKTIVDPAKLPPRLADDVCMKCHEGWSARVLQPGKKEVDFRPGTPLFETVALFKFPVGIDKREELNRLESLPPVKGTISTPMWFKHSLMAMSRCYHESKGKLRCITCHVIHDPPTEENKVAYYREKCFTCHKNKSCKLPLEERLQHEPANDCVGCHMPQRGVAGIPHSSDSNHRIVRKAGQPYPDYAFEVSDPDIPGLICTNRRGEDAKKPISPLIKLYAYNDATNSKKPEMTRYYLEALEEARQSAPDDPVVLAALGRKTLADHDDAKAVEYLRRAIERGGDYEATYLDLAEALARMGRQEESAQVLEQGVKAWPFSADIQQALVLRYMKLEWYPQAREALQRYVALFPGDPIARQALANGSPPQP